MAGILASQRNRLYAFPRLLFSIDSIEKWLDAERNHVPLWIPVAVGSGIAIWQMSGDGGIRLIALVGSALILLAIAAGLDRRIGRFLLIAALSVSIGFGAIAIKSAVVAAPVLGKVWVGSLYGRVEKVEMIGERNTVRLQLVTAEGSGLPRKVRVNLEMDQYDARFRIGAIIGLKARLMPPAGPTLPGGYDFARRAWFQQIGATGSAIGAVELYRPSDQPVLLGEMRNRLTAHIIQRMPEATGEMGAALITGDQGNISKDDAQAMRDSGMAHLLSISGLHVTAVVSFLFFLSGRLFSLFPAVALRFPVPLLAAACAAIGAVLYTMLAGAEVPTVRSCVAALLVLVALALGREAITLRLVAFGAMVVLILWPETMAGPSFQLSFAAVTTIVILHESRWMKRWAERRDETIFARSGRGAVTLIVTGLAIEIVLAPIAIFHFHRTGLYSAAANIAAIPLTTFVIMPMQASALLLDTVGLGTPFWWIAGQAIHLIITMAHYVSGLPGAISMLPSMPLWAYVSMIFGALLFGLLNSRIRLLGLVPFLVGFIAMLQAPRPDMLVTDDGKHLAIVSPDGSVAFLRTRAGDYVRDMMLENAGTRSEPVPVDRLPGAQCSEDSCVIELNRAGRIWRVLATRTPYQIPSMEMAAACRRVDIVISDRWLPASCRPKWIKADRRFLDESGGLAFFLNDLKLVSVNEGNSHMPWVQAARQAVNEVATGQ
ncbi:MAG: ComEC family competence protein [Sphingomonadaceae bacterium]|nr:ComEC family competence protein [Sphingomonadaceae bacterium]